MKSRKESEHLLQLSHLIAPQGIEIQWINSSEEGTIGHLIAPQGIEIEDGHSYKEIMQHLIAPQGIEIHINFGLIMVNYYI